MAPIARGSDAKKRPSAYKSNRFFFNQVKKTRRLSASEKLHETYATETKEPEPDPVHGSKMCCDDGINGQRIPGTPFRLGVCVGAGSFGQVRVARHLKTNQTVAVKMEPTDTDIPQLENEWQMYQTLNKKLAVGISVALHYGPCGLYNVLILPLLGPSLGQVFKECKRKFSLHTVLLLAIQLINRLEFIHSRQILHQDIKPENCLICKPPTVDNTIYLVDFGLSKYYVDRISNRHIPFSHHGHRVGTPRYMSMNAHLHMEQSRRDDMESLGHMLIYFLRGSLPWQGLDPEPNQDRHKLILDVKKATPLEELCSGHPYEFVQYMEYVRKLEFEAKPDYGRLRQLFVGRLQKEGYDLSDSMDWSAKISGKKDVKEQGHRQS